jgi:MFS family permease
MTRAPRRKRPAWLTRNVIAMGLTSLLSDLGHEMATALLPGFAATLGLSALALGAIEGIADGLSSFVKLWSGRISDRVPNRKAIVTGGYFLTGAAKALFALAHGWPIILVGRVLAWFGRGIRGPVRDAMLAESVPAAQVGRAFGFHRAGDTLGAVLGPLLALWMLAWLGPRDTTYRTLFVLTLVPGLASAFVFGLWTKDPDDRRRVPHAPRWPVHADIPRTFNRFLIAVAFFGLADFAPTLLMLRATEILGPVVGSGPAMTAAVALYVVRNVIYAAASYPIGALSDRVPRHLVLAGGYALLIFIAAGAAYPVPDVRFFLALFCLSGVLAGVQDTVEGATVVDLVPVASRGAAYGVLAAVNGVGDLLSSLMVGVLWKWFSPVIAFGVVAVLAADGAVLMATFRHQKRDHGD